ncbi:MAG TPA: aminotransferase class I/II-fold pyridoxal phosphate-dependent enzyme, partial [Planctomycetota bacterium]|nr:aminotransferase class I/II-fold pyridoxal phosphate-dependent enzyme [Planctomycetota bacterium]
MQENQRSRRLPGSATLELAARAKALALAGRPVVSMAVGEPDFQAPAAARKAAVEAIESGQVRYTPAAGMPSLRAAIARHVSATRQIPVEPAQVVVGHSCKHVLSNAL